MVDTPHAAVVDGTQEVMMTLTQWLKESGVSQSELARRLGTSRQAVQHWLVGRSSPGLYFAFAVEAVSSGAVPAESWLTHTEQLALKSMRALS